MKTRIRQLLNSLWVIEGRRWFKWRALRVERGYTTASVVVANPNAPFRAVPLLREHEPGDNNYPLTWHQTEEAAQRELLEVRSLLGE